MMELNEHEQDLLRTMNGEKRPFPKQWGAAVSECIEGLHSRALVERFDGIYSLTESGKAEAERLKAQP